MSSRWIGTISSSNRVAPSSSGDASMLHCSKHSCIRFKWGLSSRTDVAVSVNLKKEPVTSRQVLQCL